MLYSAGEGEGVRTCEGTWTKRRTSFVALHDTPVLHRSCALIPGWRSVAGCCHELLRRYQCSTRRPMSVSMRACV